MAGAAWAVSLLEGAKNQHGSAHLRFAIRDARAKGLWWTLELLTEAQEHLRRATPERMKRLSEGDCKRLTGRRYVITTPAIR